MEGNRTWTLDVLRVGLFWLKTTPAGWGAAGGLHLDVAPGKQGCRVTLTLASVLAWQAASGLPVPRTDRQTDRAAAAETLLSLGHHVCLSFLTEGLAG